MFKFIQKMHGKSESHRRNFALATSVGLTAFIFVVWISVKFATFSDDIVATKDSAQQNVITPITSFSKMTASALDGIKGSFDGLKGSVDDLGNTIKTYTNTQ